MSFLVIGLGLGTFQKLRARETTFKLSHLKRSLSRPVYVPVGQV